MKPAIIAFSVAWLIIVLCLCSCTSRSPYVTHNGHQTLITPLP